MATLVKFIDEDNGQLEIDKSELRPAVIFPAALLEFGAFTYEEASNGLQEATGTIQVRIPFAPYSSTSGKTPSAYLDKALGNYEVEKQVADCLHGWAPTGCSKLIRVTAVKENREIDTLRVRVLTFSISFKETVGQNVYQLTARPDPTIGTDVLLPV